MKTIIEECFTFKFDVINRVLNKKLKGYSSVHDEWVPSNEVEASCFKRKIRSMPRQAGPTGGGLVSDIE